MRVELSPQSATSEKTFQKTKLHKPLRISKNNQSFVPNNNYGNILEDASTIHNNTFNRRVTLSLHLELI